MLKKIKVAHILHSVGGVDVSLRLIIESINPSGFENIVIHGKDDSNHNYIDNNQKPVKEYKLSIQRDISLLKDIQSIYKTIKILRKEKPNLIHAHSAKGGVVAKVVGMFVKIPVLHTPQAYSYLSTNNNLKRKAYLLIEKLLSISNNKILASSNSERDRAINEVGYSPKKCLVFNNSIKPITTVSKLSIPKTWPDNYICSVGRPSYQKNIELMLDILFQIKKSKPDIHLVLMGVGFHAPNLERVKTKIIELELEENITLLEWTSREDIFNIINNSQVYISTARYEGLPYSVIESLALSKSIVATNCDGNRDLVKHEFNGFLIEDKNIDDFASSVLRLLNEKELMDEYSQNSLKLFLENFDMTKNIKNLEQIYINNIKDV